MNFAAEGTAVQAAQDEDKHITAATRQRGKQRVASTAQPHCCDKWQLRHSHCAIVLLQAATEPLLFQHSQVLLLCCLSESQHCLEMEWENKKLKNTVGGGHRTGPFVQFLVPEQLLPCEKETKEEIADMVISYTCFCHGGEDKIGENWSMGPQGLNCPSEVPGGSRATMQPRLQ